ncbi:unnamed protein product [Spirodela intermedia]|uniref:Acyl carrier protein n=1 Tax=Spirodela intermedia TaxID=51605 RepID=A0A7I8I9L6_SPIIN|nr:unnamed protein product [Spirodela intermedia]CAA6654113.1 unnamed protein product [Spirodela intermedia]
MAAARSALLKHLRVRVLPISARPRSPRLGTFLDKSEVADRVITVVKNFQKVDPAKVTPNAHFSDDLGLDSLDAVEVVMALEEEFGFEIPDSDADKPSTFIDFTPGLSEALPCSSGTRWAPLTGEKMGTHPFALNLQRTLEPV